MNKKLLNIGRAFTFLALSAFALTACETDIDSNPTFQANTDGFQLNVPANATNNTYDLASAEGLNLTCKQPNYGGFPLVVDYYVQVALESSFSSYRELETFYKTASMSVDAMEIIMPCSTFTPRLTVTWLIPMRPAPSTFDSVPS
jgi:hypothetical protein